MAKSSSSSTNTRAVAGDTIPWFSCEGSVRGSRVTEKLYYHTRLLALLFKCAVDTAKPLKCTTANAVMNREAKTTREDGRPARIRGDFCGSAGISLVGMKLIPYQAGTRAVSPQSKRVVNHFFLLRSFGFRRKCPRRIIFLSWYFFVIIQVC